MERPPRFRAAYRLKRSVQVFPAEDGSVYLLRLGAGDDLLLGEPRRVDRVMLEALADRSTLPQLESELKAKGLNPAEAARCLDDLREASVLDTRPPTPGPRRDHRPALRPPAHLLLGPGRARRESGRDAVAPGTGTHPHPRLRRARVMGRLRARVGRCRSAHARRRRPGRALEPQPPAPLHRGRHRPTQSRGGRGSATGAQQRAAGEPGRSSRPGPGRRRGPALPAPDLVIATADWPPHDLPRWVNRACIAAGAPWIGAGQFPPRLRVGPMVIPGRSPCLECQESAIRREHPLYDELAAWRAKGETPDASVGPVSGVIGSLLASEAMHLLIGAFEPATVGRTRDAGPADDGDGVGGRAAPRGLRSCTPAD